MTTVAVILLAVLAVVVVLVIASLVRTGGRGVDESVVDEPVPKPEHDPAVRAEDTHEMLEVVNERRRQAGEPELDERALQRERAQAEVEALPDQERRYAERLADTVEDVGLQEEVDERRTEHAAREAACERLRPGEGP